MIHTAGLSYLNLLKPRLIKRSSIREVGMGVAQAGQVAIEWACECDALMDGGVEIDDVLDYILVAK